MVDTVIQPHDTRPRLTTAPCAISDP